MPRVQVSIQDFPTHTCVIFIDRRTTQRIGPMRRFTSEHKLLEMLHRGRANLETINIVEHALRERRCCMIDLDLTDEQFEKLRR